MKYLKYLMESIRWKEFLRNGILWILVLCTICLLNQPLAHLIGVSAETIWGDTLIGPFESYVMLVLWVLIFALVFINFSSIKYHPKPWMIDALLLLGTCYFIFRFCITPQTWSFYHFNFSGIYGVEEASPVWGHLRLADILLLFLVVAVYYKLMQYHVKKPSHENSSIFSLESVKPGNNGADEFRRTDKAEFVADQIRKLESSSAFAIGIVGSWGSGKTYFIRQITELLETTDKDINVVWFTPWEAAGSNFTQFFLQSLHEKLNGEVSAKLSRYAKWLHRRAGDAKFGTALLELVEGESHPYQEVNDAILRSGKRNVIVLDDIDRLDEDEIVEVCRIIRNTANFYNTVYIMAYDKDYVVAALNKVCGDKAQEYLGKIVQFQFYLPKPPLRALQNKFRELILAAMDRHDNFNVDKIPVQLREELNSLFRSFNTQAEGRPQDTFISFFDKFIVTIRDAYTIANTYLFNITEAGKFDIVDVKELLMIEFLKLKCSKIYIRLRSREFIALGEGRRYVLTGLDDNDEEFIQDCEQITPQDVHGLMKDLFGRIASNGIASPDHFDWYFDGNTNLLKPAERFALRTKTGDELRLAIQQIADKKEDALIEYLHVLPLPETDSELERLVAIGFAIFEMSARYRNQFVGLSSILTSLPTFEGINPVHVQTALEKSILSWPDETVAMIEDWVLSRLDGGKLLPALPSTEFLNQMAIDVFERAVTEDWEYARVQKIYFACVESVGFDKHVRILPRANALMKKYVEGHAQDFIKTLPQQISSSSDICELNKYSKQIFDPLELEEFIKGVALSVDGMFILNWFERLTQEGPTSLYRDKIRLYSDRRTLVPESDGFRPAIVFSYGDNDNQVLKHSWLNETGVNYLVQTETISDDEATRGETYSFFRTVAITDPGAFDDMILNLWADDFCAVSVNGKEIVAEVEGFDLKEMKLSMAAFKPGENTIKFSVRNRSAKELGRESVTGIDNPYALAYRLDLIVKKT